jgi:macrolide-specific efflux system membrane fusion protein
MKKLRWVLAVTTVAVPLVLLGRIAATRGQERPPGLQVVRVARRTIGSSVKATGVIRPMVGAEVRVGSRASGVVRRLQVRIGDLVTKGQLLAELESRELEARRDQAAAAAAAARASRSYASADLARRRELAGAGLIAPGELDLAERASAVAEQQLAEAEASLDSARTQLAYTRIFAPISGSVASVATQEGETVAASLAAPTFVTLLDLTRLEVRAYVDETDIGRVRPGQAARFSVDTYPGQEFEARVATVYPQAEIRENVVDYVTVLRFEPPPQHTLRPEMTASVTIALESRPDVLTLPRRALRREAGETFVLCPRGAATVRRPVRVGARDEMHAEIAGLAEGDEVLVGELAGAVPENKESVR